MKHTGKKFSVIGAWVEVKLLLFFLLKWYTIRQNFNQASKQAKEKNTCAYNIVIFQSVIKVY